MRSIAHWPWTRCAPQRAISPPASPHHPLPTPSHCPADLSAGALNRSPYASAHVLRRSTLSLPPKRRPTPKRMTESRLNAPSMRTKNSSPSGRQRSSSSPAAPTSFPGDAGITRCAQAPPSAPAHNAPPGSRTTRVPPEPHPARAHHAPGGPDRPESSPPAPPHRGHVPGT